MWKLPQLTLVAQIIGSEEHQHLGSSLSVGYVQYKNYSQQPVLAVGMDSVGMYGQQFIDTVNQDDYELMGYLVHVENINHHRIVIYGYAYNIG